MLVDFVVTSLKRAWLASTLSTAGRTSSEGTSPWSISTNHPRNDDDSERRNICKYHINTIKNQLNTFPSTNFMRLYQHLWVKHKVHSPHSFCISFLRPWQDFSEVASSTHSTGLDGTTGTAASRCSKSSRNFLRAVRFSESCSIGSKVKRVRRGRQRPCQLQGPWWPWREANCRKVSRSPPKLAAKSNWSPNKAPCKPTTWSVA